MKIGKRLIASFLAVTILSSAAGIIGLVLMLRMDNGYSKALVENGFVQGDIGEYNTYLNKGGAIVRDIITHTDKAEIEASMKELDEVKIKTQEALDRASLKCRSPKELELIAKINQTSPSYMKYRDQAVALGLANKNDEAMKVFRDQARPYLNQCMEAGQELMQINIETGNQVSTSLTAQSNAAVGLIVAAIILSLTLSILFAAFTARSISKPIKVCMNRLEKLAQGDLKTEVEVTSTRDETGLMLDSLQATVNFIREIIADIARGLREVGQGNLNVTTEVTFRGDFVQIKSSIENIIVSLSDTLSQINQSAEQVSSGSDQVSSGAQALSQGATEQASSVQELAATITEISQQVKNNAQNASSASQKVNAVGSEIEESNQQMQKMIAAMADISSSSQEIGKVIKTIEDIAFQTNILALNAAVEAARAGAAGKGFAVVADEVRNLASKSAEAAKGTTALIESAVKSVENGTKIAGQTAKSLVSVVEGSQDVAEIVDKISIASGEQANSIAQVTQGVDQISSVVQTNSATAEESAAASEELSGQALMLKSLVGRFQLKGEEKQIQPSGDRAPAIAAGSFSETASSKY